MKKFNRTQKTILLTWNPKKWKWKDLSDYIEECETHGSYEDEWSVGTTKDIIQGDRFYLIRLGEEPKGIIGSGIVLSAPESKPHWDDSERSTLYVDIEYDHLFDPFKRILPMSLLDRSFPLQFWTPQSSGTAVKNEYIAKLDMIWQEFIADSIGANSSVREDPQAFSEGSSYTVMMTRYERDPRNRAACLARYGMTCVVCDMDFEERYGEIGKGFIHVHHLQPLATYGKKRVTDPVKNLRPVCPNCHAMLHRNKMLTSIEELRDQMHRVRHVPPV